MVQHDCVGALLVRGDAVLLGRRSADRAWLPGAWDVFGGHIEAGERAEDALVRELAEELGIIPLQFQSLETVGGTSPEPWRLHLFVVTLWQGEPINRQLAEHAEARWCTLAEAQQRLGAAHPDFPRLLAAALSGV
ncbi:MAG TPA: NUDIX domain-containing protein [Lysobacter sp.]|nr:NUDIX domain-containing protein [Lysobacter sp.]